MSKFKFLFLCCLFFAGLLFSGCETGTVTDVNVAMPEHRWSYINKVCTIADIKDPSKAYSIFFKLRHTSDYRYSNIYILFHTKGKDGKKNSRRFGFNLPSPTGNGWAPVPAIYFPILCPC